MLKNIVSASILFFSTISAFCQAPVITYPASEIYPAGKSITPLTPTNSGGVVPATVYGQVSTFAGARNAAFTNGTGVHTAFDNPRSAAFGPTGDLFVADANNQTIRKITPQQVVTSYCGHAANYVSADSVLIKFSWVDPVGVVADKTGNLYVADYGDSRIRKVTPGGTVSIVAGNGTKALVDGNGTAASFLHLVAITIDAANNLYVIDGNMVRKITPAGDVSLLAGSSNTGAVNATGALATFKSPTSLAADKAGNIYVTDGGNYLIRKITLQGVVTTFAGSTQGYLDGSLTTAKFIDPTAIGIDNQGNIYIYDNSVIRRVTTDGNVSTIAGNGIPDILDGPATSAEFYIITAMVPDNKGNLFMVDQLYNCIRKQVLTGYTISPLLPSGLYFDSTTGTISGTPQVVTPATNYKITAYNASGINSTTISIATPNVQAAPVIASFWPQSLNAGQVISITGNYFSDATAVSVGGVPVKSFNILSPDTLTAMLGAGTTSGNISVTNPYGTASVGGFKVLAAPNITYSSPQTYKVGVSISPLVPANTGGDVPAELYRQVSTYAGSRASGFRDGAALTQALFNGPNSVATDGTGNIFVADFENNRIRKITRDGTVSTFAGTGLPSFADGFGKNASFSAPSGLAFDASGNLYVADAHNSKIRKITPAGLVSTLASGIANPTSLVVDPGGNIYVAAYARIVKITSAGIISSFAGSGPSYQATGTSGYADGTGFSARFSNLTGIALDPTGNLYVVDNGNSRIRKISPSASVTTFAGSGVQGYQNGPAAQASFFAPSGIAIDHAGNILVTEYNDIRQIDKQSVVSTYAGIFYQTERDGSFDTASFLTPTGVNFDNLGNLFVADNVGASIRKLAVTGYEIVPALPPGLAFDAKTGIISGTPALVTPSATYSITGHNSVGSSTNTVSITITVAKPQTISFDSLANIKYGSADVPLKATSNSGLQVTYSSSNSSVATIVNGNLHITGAGTTIITASQTGNSVYDAALAVNQALTVSPAALIIRANNISRNYGDDNPVFTASYIGFANGDNPGKLTVQPVLSTTATVTSAVGTYTINASGAASANYTIAYLTGTLTVVPVQGTPVISSLTPATATAGTTVTINGANLTGTTAVSFGGTAAASFTVVSPTSITAVVGGGSSGKVLLTNPSGNTAFSGFSFIPQPAIATSGPTTFSTNGGSVTLAAIPDSGFIYQWFQNGVIITGANAPTFTATQTGSYTLSVALNSVTKISAPVAVTAVFMLPADNFQLDITSASCKGSANGTVNITALQSANYVASVTGNGINSTYPFTTTAAISNLPAGTYNICLTVAGEPLYQQCFTSIISEPKDLSLYTVVSRDDKVTLMLNGGESYNINLNGALYNTSEDQITLSLSTGKNTILVSTDKICQGVIEKDIIVSNELVFYPNPFENLTYIGLGKQVINNADVTIYSADDGKIVYTAKFTNPSASVKLDLTALRMGVYTLKLSADNTDTLFKIVKK